MATGNDIKGVGRELEEGLFALANFEGLGGRQHGLADASGLLSCIQKGLVSVMQTGP